MVAWACSEFDGDGCNRPDGQVSAADALVEEVVHALGAELFHEGAAGGGGFVVWLTDDEMVFYGDGLRAENDGGGGAIRMAGARGAADDDEWRFINQSLVPACFRELAHHFPRRHAAWMNVGMLRTALRIALRHYTPNVNLEKIADGAFRPFG